MKNQDNLSQTIQSTARSQSDGSSEPGNRPQPNTRRLGTACVLAASLCLSTGGLLMKLIPWNPLAINGVRNAIAAVVIGLYILATHHKLKFNPTVLVGAISMVPFLMPLGQPT